MKRLRECQSDKYENYLMPLFWQHGETHEEILRGICAIEKCGIREFCVESRVYEDFCGDKWWRDFGFILTEQKSAVCVFGFWTTSAFRRDTQTVL